MKVNTEEYINSGILHEYCMNSLSENERIKVEQVCAQYPEVRDELQQMQQVLEKFAQSVGKKPASEVQQTIWGTLENINKEKAGDLNDLPLINKYSDHNNWKRIVKSLIPAQVPDERLMLPLRNLNGLLQVLVISKTDVDDEVHEHERESFLVLEGECECHVGNDTFRLGPGGFLEIPLYKSHNVKVLSPYVVAVLQHVAL